MVLILQEFCLRKKRGKFCICQNDTFYVPADFNLILNEDACQHEKDRLVTTKYNCKLCYVSHFANFSILCVIIHVFLKFTVSCLEQTLCFLNHCILSSAF